jgi:hypothetical protein
MTLNELYEQTKWLDEHGYSYLIIRSKSEHFGYSIRIMGHYPPSETERLTVAINRLADVLEKQN